MMCNVHPEKWRTKQLLTKGLDCSELLLFSPGSTCPIHPCAFDFPRYVGMDRGEMYTPYHLAEEGLEGYEPPITVPLGNIPQVERTYQYFDGSYGMMNEKQ